MIALPTMPGSRPERRGPDEEEEAHRREPRDVAEDVLGDAGDQEQQEEDDPRAPGAQELFDPLDLVAGERCAATKGLPSARARKKLAVEPMRMPATERSVPCQAPKR